MADPAPILIGLMGSKQSGKDTAADYIMDVLPGTFRVAFADNIRDAALALDPWVEVEHRPGIVPLVELVESIGWEEAKVAHPGVRSFLQRFGTDCVRNHLGEDIWVNVAMEQVDIGIGEGFSCVITDVRFRNEIGAIRDRGGSVWRIDRKVLSMLPADPHVSENEWRGEKADFAIDNDGTLAEFYQRILDGLYLEEIRR